MAWQNLRADIEDLFAELHEDQAELAERILERRRHNRLAQQLEYDRWRRVAMAEQRREVSKRWRSANLEHNRAIQRDYYQRHREEILAACAANTVRLEKQKQWHRDNRERVKATQRAWYVRNRDRILAKLAAAKKRPESPSF